SLLLPVLPTSQCFYSTCPAPPRFYTLSLHDALPISPVYAVLDEGGKLFWGWGSLFTDPIKRGIKNQERRTVRWVNRPFKRRATRDRKSTRLNSSHVSISYAVFCLKKKKQRRMKSQDY